MLLGEFFGICHFKKSRTECFSLDDLLTWLGFIFLQLFSGFKGQQITLLTVTSITVSHKGLMVIVSGLQSSQESMVLLSVWHYISFKWMEKSKIFFFLYI